MNSDPLKFLSPIGTGGAVRVSAVGFTAASYPKGKRRQNTTCRAGLDSGGTVWPLLGETALLRKTEIGG